jgi:hypothetical protein
VTVRLAQRVLRLTDRVTAKAERDRLDVVRANRRADLAAHREALRSSRRFADQAAGLVLSEAQRQRAPERTDAYWQLMRSGETNANACRLLGMSRRSICVIGGCAGGTIGIDWPYKYGFSPGSIIGRSATTLRSLNHSPQRFWHVVNHSDSAVGPVHQIVSRRVP